MPFPTFACATFDSGIALSWQMRSGSDVDLGGAAVLDRLYLGEISFVGWTFTDAALDLVLEMF